MFCSKCGKEIDDSAVVCVNCGAPTQNLNKNNQQQQPIIINNSSSSSSSASAAAINGRIRRHHSLLLDILLIFITGGLWIIWMIIRPKYY